MTEEREPEQRWGVGKHQRKRNCEKVEDDERLTRGKSSSFTAGRFLLPYTVWYANKQPYSQKNNVKYLLRTYNFCTVI